MFAVGEYVYYASEGVCHVADICCAPLCGMPADRIYYVLHPFRNNGGVLYVPSEWVRVIKTVRERVSRIRGSSRAQRISETERGFAEDAKRYLYAELSLALDVPVGEMEQYIRNRIETCSA